LIPEVWTAKRIYRDAEKTFVHVFWINVQKSAKNEIMKAVFRTFLKICRGFLKLNLPKSFPSKVRRYLVLPAHLRSELLF